MNSIIIPFTVTADQLNAADTADQTILTFRTDSRAVRVPTRLEVYRAAGTAYTFTQLYRHRAEDHRNFANDFHVGGAFLAIRSTHTQGNREAPQDDLFYASVEGILDQADAAHLVALPLVNGKTFRPGATTLVLRSTCQIASGTGDLTCRLYLDEYALQGA